MPALPTGLGTVDAGGAPFRVLVKATADGARVAVAQETAARDDIARDSGLRTLMPCLILVPILILVVADLVRTMLRPIATLCREIDQRDEQDLRPVEDNGLAIEVPPFVAAINRLLSRVAQSMEEQRRFVADAAHELRSPLTAMSLQTERLAQAYMSALYGLAGKGYRAWHPDRGTPACLPPLLSYPGSEVAGSGLGLSIVRVIARLGYHPRFRTIGVRRIMSSGSGPGKRRCAALPEDPGSARLFTTRNGALARGLQTASCGSKLPYRVATVAVPLRRFREAHWP